MIKALINIYCLAGLLSAYIILKDNAFGYLAIIIYIEGVYMFNKDLKFLLNMYSNKKMIKIKIYSVLTKQYRNREPLIFDRLILLKFLNEFDNNFYPVKIEITNNNTRIYYEKINDSNYKVAEKNINKLIGSFNRNYCKNIVFLKIEREKYD
ncbi:MAG: hypothetical protein JXB50_08125 [Spirochaetes bacterium]|nr:hypothetical protein [Spirochaetota bacterium]